MIAAALALAPAAPASAQTLEEAIAIARNENPDLAAVGARSDAADARLDRARSARLPQVTAEGQYSYSRIDYGTGPFGFGEQTVEPYSARLTAEQLLFAGGRVNASIKSAQSAHLSADELRRDVEARLIADVAEVYLDVVVTEAAVTQREANLAALAELRRQTEARFQSGEVPRSDVALAEARLAGAEAELARARGDRQARQYAFERVIGVAPQKLSAAVEAPPVPAALDEALAQANLSNPLLARAHHEADAADAVVRSARASRFPTITVGVEAARVRDEFLLGYEADSAALVARARLPLFTGGRIDAEVREARAKASEALAVQRGAVLAVREAVARAFAQHQAAIAAKSAAKRQALAAKAALDDIRLEVKAGARPAIDGLDAESDHLAALLELDAATAEVVASAYRLHAAIGSPLPARAE
jgi:outer membrane protein